MYLGIDLGTSNSAVYGHIDGEMRLFKTSDGSDVLPSAIYKDKRGHIFVGRAATDRLVSAPENVAVGFKRLMGTSSPVSIAGENWSSEDCSAQIIKTLVGQATMESGSNTIDGTIITIPAAFNQMQSEATLNAARSAGLDRVALLQEPVAASMAAIAQTVNKDGVFLVYDLGGGTFDVALVLSTDGVVNVIDHEGVNMLGGRDFDRLVFDNIVRTWIKSNFSVPDNFQSDPKYKSLAAISRFAIERAKIQLSTSENATIFASEDEVRVLDLDGKEIYLSIEISRNELETVVREKIDQTIDLCRNVISRNGYTHEDLTKVVPIGGPSRMPLIRELLETELGIAVERNLDPMTAVAYGAAIFAESRAWESQSSQRKAETSRERYDGKVSVIFDYKTRCSSNSTKLRIKPDGEIADGYSIEVIDDAGAASGKKPLEGPVVITLNLRAAGENRFRVNVFAPDGSVVEEASRVIVIVKTEASAASIPMTYTLAVKAQSGTVGYERNELIPILEKGAPLPAEGQQRFRSGKTLKGGEPGTIAFEFFEMSKGIQDPAQNLHIGDFELDAERDLDLGERIERGDDLIVHWKMSDSGTLEFSVELPKIGAMINARNLYLAPAGHINFEGRNGAEAAATLLSKAEQALDELNVALDGTADANGELRRRIESQHAILSSSTDADSNRSVAEEARKVRQEIELLRLSPQNEEKVLTRAVDKSEADFDGVRRFSELVDADRHDKIVVTARRAIREKDFDLARRSVAEMTAIKFKALSQNPEFLIDFIRHLDNERHLVTDAGAHEQHIKEANQVAKSRDVERLKGVIGKMLANRPHFTASASDIVDLADILSA